MALVDIAKRLDSLASVASLGGRTLLGLDTNPVPTWDHITKVDPEHGKKLPLAYPLYLARTGGVSVGGSQEVTDRNTEETLDLITAAEVPAFQEPSAPDHVTEQTRDTADFLAIPEVLNGDTESLIGTLGGGIDYTRSELAPEMIADKLGSGLAGLAGGRLSDFAAGYMLEEAVFEAYIIMNLDSAAAREANVTEDDLLSVTEAKERALAAEYRLESEIIYVEYSGTYGGDEAVEMLEAIDEATTWPRLWYGGGVDSREKARAVRDAGADAVIVGDAFHDVAEEEASLVEAAFEEFETNPDREHLREWIDDEIDVEDSAAARYLSTIPTLPEPDMRAIDALTAGVSMALALRDLARGLDDPDEADIDAALEAEETLPGESAFTDVISGPRPLARRLSAGLLADRFDADEDPAVARHLAVSL
jgi:phosphoglycerol geranylgeranyltransferase